MIFEGDEENGKMIKHCSRKKFVVFPPIARTFNFHVTLLTIITNWMAVAVKYEEKTI